MNKLFRYLFAVQYSYRDAVQATRARILLPLTSIIAILALIFGIAAAVAALAGASTRSTLVTYGIAAPALLIWTIAALWLTQRGSLRSAATMIGVLLWAIAAVSLLTDGLAPGPVLTLPLVLTYMGLAYGARGTVLSILLVWIALPATAYLQSEGMLHAEAEPRGTLLSEAAISALMLTLAALLLWAFAWNLQRALLRVTRSAAQTRATAEAGQVIARILNIDELLTRAVDLLRDRFAFYHVQIFLVDETNPYANLAASTGEIGHALLAQGYRVPLGPRTVVGEAIAMGELRYVSDLAATGYRRSEMLADTLTQLAIPLTAGEQVVGALDIQSLRLHAFTAEDIEAVRVIANQLSQAIQNARLFEAQQRSLLQNRRLFLESETNLREIERLNRQLTGQSWREYLNERDASQFSVRLSGQDAAPAPAEWTPTMQQAMSRQRMVSQDEDDEQVLAVPINIRGQPVGAIEVRLPPHQSQAEVRTIVQAVAERMAFSLENARLFEQARTAAEREQQLNLITARLQGLTSVEDVLATAISTLGQALGADRGLIRLVPLDIIAPPDTPSTGNQPVTGGGNGHLNQDQHP